MGLVTAVVVGWARAVGGCGEPAGEELRHLEKNGEKVAQTLRREQHGHSAEPSVPLQRESTALSNTQASRRLLERRGTSSHLRGVDPETVKELSVDSEALPCGPLVVTEHV